MAGGGIAFGGERGGDGGGSTPSIPNPVTPPPSRRRALHLEAGAYLIYQFFLKKKKNRSVRINISTSAIVLPLEIILPPTPAFSRSWRVGGLIISFIR